MGGRGGSLWKQVTFRLSNQRFEPQTIYLSMSRWTVQAFTFHLLFCFTILPFFSDKTVTGGGYLSVEDALGSTTNTYLEEGFFDFLNEVVNQHCYNYYALYSGNSGEPGVMS